MVSVAMRNETGVKVRKGVLFLCCGPSGVGKTSLGRRLREDYKKLVLSVSYTTRGMREGEQNGVDYHFVDEAEFMKMRDAGEFAEWAHVHGNYYATPRSEIVDAWQRGEDVFFDIDYQGAKQLQDAFPEECVSVLVIPPGLDVLEERLRSRSTDSDEVIERRLKAARYELMQYEVFDYLVCNDDFEVASGELENIYLASLQRTGVMEPRLKAMLGLDDA